MRADKDRRQDARMYRLESIISNITNKYPMNIDWIGSPNYTEGRKYYWTYDNFKNRRIGKLANVDTIVYHWINGNLNLADRVFLDSKKQVSAHFGIEDSIVHQYVKRENTAWHCGNGKINSESIGIEHSAQPDRPATDSTYETSAQLVYFICSSMGKRVDDFKHIGHKEIVPTQCPGTLDIQRIVNRAREIEAQNISPIDQPVNEVPAVEGELVSFEKKKYERFETDLAPSQEYRKKVIPMQEFLIDKGFLQPIPINEFGYYGLKTQTAVDKFQKANGIPTATKLGWWYPATREKANKQL